MECLLAICLALGITANTYDTLEPTYALNFKAGNEVYVWGSFEEQDIRILGQGITDANIYSGGVGARYDLDNFFGFIEVGYAINDEVTNREIAREIIYTALVNNHSVRPIPSGDPENDPDAKVMYELGDGYVGRVGVGYSYKHINVTAAYRFFGVREHYELWSQVNRDKGLGWWQESHGRDLSAFEIGLSWTF